MAAPRYEVMRMPEDATLLGTVAGDVYVRMGDTHVWFWDGTTWRFYCTGEAWAASSIAATLEAKQRGARR